MKNRFTGSWNTSFRGLCIAVCFLLVSGGHADGTLKEGEGTADLVEVQDSLFFEPDSLATADTLHVVTENPIPKFVTFGEGEKFLYSIQYGIISAGEATLEIRNIAYIDSIACYHIISDARSNAVFSKFFKVRDRFESFMDTVSLISLYYEKHLREGKYRKNESVTFDQIAHEAIYKDRKVPIPPRTQDVLSSLYYVRTLPLEVGQSFAVANHTNGKNYPLVIKVLREEQITVEAGTFDCIVVEPLLRSAGLFKHKGRLTVWLTNDKYRVPVLMESKVVIGAISAVLKSFELSKKVKYAEQVRGRESYQNTADID